jgi:hypothetical protein
MFNSYNSGAATTIVGGAVGGGGMCSHTDYGITNNEWTLNGGTDTLMSYMALRLNIRNDFIRFGGIRDYYVRNEYGLDYSSCRSGVGVVRGNMLLDPWTREFPIFPERSNTIHHKPKRSSGYMASLYDYECFHSSLWGNAVDVLNVYVLSTSVCGNRVYCVDVLS